MNMKRTLELAEDTITAVLAGQHTDAQKRHMLADLLKHTKKALDFLDPEPGPPTELMKLAVECGAHAGENSAGYPNVTFISDRSLLRFAEKASPQEPTK